MREEDVKSFDGENLHFYIFDQVKSPRAIVQIAHGMQEYSKTYFKFAKFLNENGIVVVCFDERSHGKTAGNYEKLGKVSGDTFSNIVSDHVYFSDLIKEKSALPLILFAHSYGSFIGQKYLEVGGAADKVILSGTSFMRTPTIMFGKIVASLGCLFKGKDKPAKLIEKLSFKSYQKHCLFGSWITRDEQETKEFYDDKYNGSEFSFGFYKNMFSQQLRLYKKKLLKNIDLAKPILLISGSEDPVGQYGKGVAKLHRIYKKLGLNATLKMYDGARHGLVQETNKEEIFKDVLSFILS